MEELAEKIIHIIEEHQTLVYSVVGDETDRYLQPIFYKKVADDISECIQKTIMEAEDKAYAQGFDDCARIDDAGEERINKTNGGLRN